MATQQELIEAENNLRNLGLLNNQGSLQPNLGLQSNLGLLSAQNPMQASLQNSLTAPGGVFSGNTPGGAFSQMSNNAVNPPPKKRGVGGFFRDAIGLALNPNFVENRQMRELIDSQNVPQQTKDLLKLLSRNEQIEYLTGVNEGKDRRIVVQDGIQYYVDTGERVLPNVINKGKEYKPPSSYQEYTLIDDTPTPKEYKEFLINHKKAGAQIINVGPQGQQFGDPPKDTAWQRNELGEVVIDDRGIPVALPIQGTNLFRQQEKSSDQKEKSGDEVIVTGGVVLGNIDRIRNKIENSVLPTTGIGGQMLRNIGGTAALDVSKLLAPIEASIGFDRLQRMREASPTGGALGQVSERELELLMATLSSLDQAQTEEQFLESLALIETRYTKIIKKFNAYPEQAMLEVGYVPRNLNPDNLEIDGYIIKPK